jgi:hypothetical protein
VCCCYRVPSYGQTLSRNPFLCVLLVVSKL